MSYKTNGVCDDARCLFAEGPECTCACLGAAHSEGLRQMGAAHRVTVSAIDQAVREARVAARLAGLASAARFAAKQAAAAEQDDDEEDGCEGHESLDGAHMGETVYCDGTCRMVARMTHKAVRDSRGRFVKAA